MKKFILVIVLGLAGLVALFSYIIFSNPPQPTDKPVACSDLLSADVSSERSFGLLISNRKLLTIKQEAEKNFAPPGGHVEPQEAPTTALQRELSEELGLNVDEADLASYKVFCRREQENIVRTYYYLIDAPEDQAINIVSQSDSLKYVDYQFVDDKKADLELTNALNYLKSDELID